MPSRVTMANATEAQDTGLSRVQSGPSPSDGAASRATAATAAPTAARVSAVLRKETRSAWAAPVRVVTTAIRTPICPAAPSRSQVTAAKTTAAKTRSRAPPPSSSVWMVTGWCGAPRGAEPESSAAGSPAATRCRTHASRAWSSCSCWCSHNCSPTYAAAARCAHCGHWVKPSTTRAGSRLPVPQRGQASRSM